MASVGIPRVIGVPLPCLRCLSVLSSGQPSSFRTGGSACALKADVTLQVSFCLASSS